jgi:hypothetical protein
LWLLNRQKQAHSPQLVGTQCRSRSSGIEA